MELTCGHCGSFILYLVSCILYLVSCILHLVSCILYLCGYPGPVSGGSLNGSGYPSQLRVAWPDAGSDRALKYRAAPVWRGGPAAGEVKARGERRRVRSDSTAVERERGISVSSAVMSFEHQGLAFNLLRHAGH